MAPPVTGLPDWIKEAKGEPCLSVGVKASSRVIDRNLKRIASFMREAALTREPSRKSGLMQSIESRARIAGVLLLIIAGAMTSGAYVLAGLYSILLAVAVLSGVSPVALIKRVAPSVALTALIIAPVFFSFMTPGREVLRIGGAAMTAEGFATGLFFIARASLLFSLASVLMLTTGQTDLFRGLRGLPVPGFFVTALFMAFRYIFILIKVAEDATLARKSRTIDDRALRDAGVWFGSRAAFILKRSLSTAEEVGMAMASRGFTGSMAAFDPGPLRGVDYLWIGFTTFVLFLAFGL